MMKMWLLFLVLVFLAPTWSKSGFAASQLERVTLMLVGDECDSFSRDIETALKAHPGVRFIDGQSLSGHLLIDVDPEQVTADELVRSATELETLRQRACRASVMQSCITAGAVPVVAQ